MNSYIAIISVNSADWVINNTINTLVRVGIPRTRIFVFVNSSRIALFKSKLEGVANLVDTGPDKSSRRSFIKACFKERKYVLLEDNIKELKGDVGTIVGTNEKILAIKNCEKIHTGPTYRSVVDSDAFNVERRILNIRHPVEFVAARDNLLTILRNSTIPKIHSRIAQIGPIGRTTNFGHGDTRNGVKDYVTNGRQPELFRALAELGNLVVPVGWDYNGITLNHGVLAKKHKDSKNLGPSIIIGIGDFQGGAIRVWDAADEDPQEFDLKDTPIMFNGGLLYHETVPFTGERYTIIYYKQLFEGKAAGVEMIGR